MPQSEVSGIQPNILEQFTSFNTIFTISAITSEQLNYPDSPQSYKNNNLGEIILRSGSGMPDNRIRTAYTSADNPGGQFEFYIDNVQIDSLISFDKRTNGSNATNITFDVIEPYSMGMFLQVLQLAAAAVADDGAVANYTETPFLMTIEFIGYDDSGNIVPIDDALNRHIPFTFTNMELEVTGSGSRYKVTAIPYNEDALKDSVARFKEDISVSGTTVQEILQSGSNSLTFRLTSQKKEIAKQGSETNKEEYVPDQIAIIFPKINSKEPSTSSTEDSGQSTTTSPSQEPGADVAARLNLSQRTVSSGSGDSAVSASLLVQDNGSLNKIGSSEMGFDLNTGGESKAVPANKVQDNPDKPAKRKNNYYDPKDKVFKFSQGTSIISAITEILLMSEYCKKSVEQPPDANGMKPWFRIETQVYNLKPNQGNAKRAKRPRLYVFKVVEYLVHEHRFKPPGAAPQGYDELKKNCVKEYNYIYSGKNVDIINFNINLKTAMFTTAYNDMNALAGSVYTQINGAGTDTASQPTNNSSNNSSADAGVPTPPTGELYKRYRNVGDGPNDDYRSLIAKNFQDALLNSPADMMTMELEIMGDPYYLADSGMGNFSDMPQTFNQNSDGSMNYQSGEVDIILNFRTPVDYSSTGEIEFSKGFDAAGFSGLYNVLEVENKWSGSKYTQLLKTIRRPIQDPKATTPTKPITAAGTSPGPVAAFGQTYTPPPGADTADPGYIPPGNDSGSSATVNPNNKSSGGYTRAMDSTSSGTRGTQVAYKQATNTKIPGTN